MPGVTEQGKSSAVYKLKTIVPRALPLQAQASHHITPVSAFTAGIISSLKRPQVQSLKISQEAAVADHCLGPLLAVEEDSPVTV